MLAMVGSFYLGSEELDCIAPVAEFVHSRIVSRYITYIIFSIVSVLKIKSSGLLPYGSLFVTWMFFLSPMKNSFPKSICIYTYNYTYTFNYLYNFFRAENNSFCFLFIYNRSLFLHDDIYIDHHSFSSQTKYTTVLWRYSIYPETGFFK